MKISYINTYVANEIIFDTEELKEHLNGTCSNILQLTLLAYILTTSNKVIIKDTMLTTLIDMLKEDEFKSKLLKSLVKEPKSFNDFWTNISDTDLIILYTSHKINCDLMDRVTAIKHIATYYLEEDKLVKDCNINDIATKYNCEATVDAIIQYQLYNSNFNPNW